MFLSLSPPPPVCKAVVCRRVAVRFCEVVRVLFVVRGAMRVAPVCLLDVFSLAVVFSYRGAYACLRAVRFLEVCVVDHALNPASLPGSPVFVLNFRLKYGSQSPHRSTR